MAIAVRGMPDLLERDELLVSLEHAYRDARNEQGALVFVGGEAGVGKTSLAHRFCADLPATVLWGACDPLATPRPLGPLLDVAQHASAPLATAIEGTASPHEVAAALMEGVRGAPLVVVLEDVHWADEATLDVLRVLGRRIGSSPTLVLATYRDDELDRAHPLRVVLGELATSTACVRLAVEPLTREGVERLAVGRDVDAAALHRLTAGNPFYVVELLASGGTTTPGSVRDVVMTRVARLTPHAVAVVEAASVAPPSLDADLLLGICGPAADAADECLDAGVLRTAEGGVAFRHELARTAVEEALSPTRRLALHRAVLLALTETDRGPVDLARIAHHAEAASDTEAVLRYAPAAAEEAARFGAYREAAAQYARALRFGASLGPGERAKLLEGRSRACYLADDQVEAIEVIRDAIRCRREQRAPVQEARALTELADYLSCRGFLADSQDAIRRASTLVSGQPEEREHAYVLNAEGRFREDADADARIELAGKAIEIGARFGDEHVAGHARVTVGVATALCDLDAGLALLEEAARIARRHGQAEVVARALNGMGAVSMDWHRYDVADAYYDAGLAHCVEHASDLWRINILALSALSLLAQGRFDDASQRVAAILDDPRESPWPHHTALVVLALVRARRGDPGALDALADAATVDVQPEEVDAFVDRAAAQAEIAWMERRPEEVDEATGAMLQAAAERGDTEAICRLAFWRRLAGIEADSPEGASGPYALALAGEWERAAREWQRRGQPYEAALALSQSGEVESLRRAHAELQRLGARPVATMVARDLRERGARAIPRGPRRSTQANAAHLTRRELDVLALLAEGRRNAEIAGQLYLSRRTVDHHVSAILRKLEAQTRGEAVAAAVRVGVLDER